MSLEFSVFPSALRLRVIPASSRYSCVFALFLRLRVTLHQRNEIIKQITAVEWPWC